LVNELDEGVDVPADPAAEMSIRQRIDSLCGLPTERSEASAPLPRSR
jgi:hypothetical protein